MGDGIKEGDEVFISYMNDDNSIRSGFFVIINITDLVVEIKGKQGSVSLLPMSRVLKIKKRGVGE